MYRCLAVIGVLVLCSTSVLAQAPAPVAEPRVTGGDATQAVLERIVGRLEKIESRLDSADARGRTGDAVSKTEFDGRIAELNAKWDDLNERVRLQHRDLAEIVSRDSRDMPTLRLRAMMDKNPDFRNELTQVVRELAPSGPQNGIVRIENQMAADQTIRVNGQTFVIPALQAHDISVPVGTATTELVGFEAAKTWPIPTPNYVQRVTIHPSAARIVVQSPIMQTPVVQQPVVVQSPVYWYW